jgi:hypothetical protein
LKKFVITLFQHERELSSVRTRASVYEDVVSSERDVDCASRDKVRNIMIESNADKLCPRCQAPFIYREGNDFGECPDFDCRSSAPTTPPPARVRSGVQLVQTVATDEEISPEAEAAYAAIGFPRAQ